MCYVRRGVATNIAVIAIITRLYPPLHSPQVCYVGYDLELEKKLALETTTVMEKYTLPDGRVINVSSLPLDLLRAHSDRSQYLWGYSRAPSPTASPMGDGTRGHGTASLPTASLPLAQSSQDRDSIRSPELTGS